MPKSRHKRRSQTVRRNKAGAPILAGHASTCACGVCKAMRGEVPFPYVCAHCDEVVVEINVTDPAQRRMAKQRTRLHETHCQGPAA
ncbi:hypothetical protein ACH4C6_07520 [Streptomyces sp. NPDC017943]|uniref:hypothetical protein n=1 Tax=Streptomyces sp. NPDC017943 TaxID=3365019 RepID=UPI0037A38875